MKRDGKKITMMTAYDVAFARLVDRAGIDVLLVGDSAGMVMLGYPNTVPVTMDNMIQIRFPASQLKHLTAVVTRRGAQFLEGR